MAGLDAGRVRRAGKQAALALGIWALLVIALPVQQAGASYLAWQTAAESLPMNEGNTRHGASLTTNRALRTAARPFYRRPPDRRASKIVLALVVGMVAAFNFWIFHHIYRVYLLMRRDSERITQLAGPRTRPQPSYIEDHTSG